MEDSSLDIRKKKEEYKSLVFKNPNMIPVILSYQDIRGGVTEHKILVPKAFTYQEFLYSLRKKLKIGEKNTLFLQVEDKVLPALDKSLLNVYKEYKNIDGFLYIRATIENHLGFC